MPHPVDRFVGRAFLLDIGVGARDIRLGLIVIVVRNEILDRIFREERFHLAIELCGKDLVRREDQRRALHRLDHLGHCEGLARAGDAEQHLITLARLRLRDQLGDRGRLIAGCGIFADDLEGLAALQLGRAVGAMGNERLAGLRFVERGADLNCHGTEYGVRALSRQRLAMSLRRLFPAAPDHAFSRTFREFHFVALRFPGLIGEAQGLGGHP